MYLEKSKFKHIFPIVFTFICIVGIPNLGFSQNKKARKLIKRADNAQVSGDCSKAREFANKALSKGDDSGSSEFILSLCTTESERKLDYLNRACNKNSRNYKARDYRQEIRFDIAQQHYRVAEYLKAEKLTEAIINDKSSVYKSEAIKLLEEARIKYARMLVRGSKYKEAEQYFTKVLVNNPIPEIQRERTEARFDYARQMYGNQQYELADTFYQKILEENPRSSIALKELTKTQKEYADVLHSNQLYEKAETYYNKILSRESQNIEIKKALLFNQLTYARYLKNEEDDYEKAIEYFEKVIKENNNIQAELDDTYCFYAKKLRKEKVYTKATNYLEKIRNKYLKCFLEEGELIICNQVEDNFVLRDYYSAEEKIKDGLKIYPHSKCLDEQRTNTYLALAREVSENDRFNEAHQYLDKLSTTNEVNSRRSTIYQLQANKAKVDMYYEVCIEFLNKALGLVTHQPEEVLNIKKGLVNNYFILYDLAVDSPNYDLAHELLDKIKALSHISQNLLQEVKEKRIELYFLQTKENTEKAIKLLFLEQILFLDASNSKALELRDRVWYELAIQSNRGGNYEKAIDYLDLLLDNRLTKYKGLEELKANIWLAIGRREFLNRRYLEAEKAYKEAEKSNHLLNLQIAFLKSEVYAHLFNLDQAIHLLEYCLQNDYEIPESVYRLARYHCIKGELSLAMNYLYFFQASLRNFYQNYQQQAWTQNDFYNLKDSFEFQMWLKSQRRVQIQVHRVINIPDKDWTPHPSSKKNLSDPVIHIICGNDSKKCIAKEDTHEANFNDCILNTNYDLNNSSLYLEVADDDGILRGLEKIGVINLSGLPIPTNVQDIRGDVNMVANISLTDFSHGTIASSISPDLRLSYIQIGWEFTYCSGKVVLPLPAFAIVVAIESAIKANQSNYLKAEIQAGSSDIIRKYASSQLKNVNIRNAIKVYGYANCLWDVVEKLEALR